MYARIVLIRHLMRVQSPYLMYLLNRVNRGITATFWSCLIPRVLKRGEEATAVECTTPTPLSSLLFVLLVEVRSNWNILWRDPRLIARQLLQPLVYIDISRLWKALHPHIRIWTLTAFTLPFDRTLHYFTFSGGFIVLKNYSLLMPCSHSLIPSSS